MFRTPVTTLIPIQELTPGQVGKIRNDVINAVVAIASKELSMPPEKLVVRDIRPKADLAMYGVGATTALTTDVWKFITTTTTANTFYNMTANPTTMGDQRYVALFGVRDLRASLSPHDTATAPRAIDTYSIDILYIKLIVGGAEKAIWDLQSVESYPDYLVGFTQAAIVIPQNASYAIQYLRANTYTGMTSRIQLIGIVVEPRGKLISP